MLKRTRISLLLCTIFAFLSFSLLAINSSKTKTIPFHLGKSGLNIYIPATWVQNMSIKSSTFLGLFLKKKKLFYPNINFFLYPKANTDAKAKKLITKIISTLPQNKNINQGEVSVSNLTFHTLHNAWFINRKIYKGWLEAYRYSGYIPKVGSLFITCVYKSKIATSKNNMKSCQQMLQSLSLNTKATPTKSLQTSRQ